MISKRWTRTFLIVLFMVIIEALYVWIRYRPEVWSDFAVQFSNATFQFGLLMFMAGLLYVTRFIGFRGRYHLPRMLGWSVGDYQPNHAEEEYNEQEAERQRKKVEDEKAAGVRRDPSLIFAALFLILLSVVITMI
jgi:hypothetical protein